MQEIRAKPALHRFTRYQKSGAAQVRNALQLSNSRQLSMIDSQSLRSLGVALSSAVSMISTHSSRLTPAAASTWHSSSRSQAPSTVLGSSLPPQAKFKAMVAARPSVRAMLRRVENAVMMGFLPCLAHQEERPTARSHGFSARAAAREITGDSGSIGRRRAYLCAASHSFVPLTCSLSPAVSASTRASSASWRARPPAPVSHSALASSSLVQDDSHGLALPARRTASARSRYEMARTGSPFR